MPRHIGSLALALVVALASSTVLVESVEAAPPSEGPIQGPAPPPSEPPPSEPPPSEPTPSEPSEEPTDVESAPLELPPPSIDPGEGIEFATQPESSADPRPPMVESDRDRIGKAPDSGASFLAGGLWLVPIATWGTTVLVIDNQATQYEPGVTAPGIIAAGAGLGAIGLTMIGVGAYRQVMLNRWAKRHRVIALPQGSGLITSGTLAGLFGIGMLIAGIRAGDPITGGIAGALIVSSPIQIGVGLRFLARYQRSGGWRRTRYTLTPGGFQMQF